MQNVLTFGMNTATNSKLTSLKTESQKSLKRPP